MKTVTDGRGNTTTYSWWENDLLKSVKDALNNTVSFFYDGARNLTKVVFPNGNETYYAYTDDNLLSGISYKNEETSYSFSYNPTHTLKKVEDDLGRTFGYSYNGVGWMIEATDTANPDISGGFRMSQAYDEAGRVTGLRISSEDTRTYEYNARGDLTGLLLPTDPQGTHTSFTYDDERQLTGVTTPDETTRSYSYDAAGRITSLDTTTSSGSTHFSYGYDANGNVTSENNTRYAYDALNRLKKWFDPSREETTTYYYDAAGNLTSAFTFHDEGTATATHFTYDEANRISNYGFSYDANGNMTSDLTFSYRYDGENRLTQVTRKEDSSTVASYEYDYLGRRIKAVEETATTYFHYDGINVIAESDASGTVAATYSYDDKGRLVSMTWGGATYYYQTNAHGDVVSLTNSSGEIVNTYSYDPWGKVISASETVANPYRYASYRYDSSTGLYYLFKRYYSPAIYRFLTKDIDPGDLRIPQTLNPYLYVNNNPTNLADPTGEDWTSVGLAALGTFATIAGTAALVTGAPVLGVGALGWGIAAGVIWAASVGYSYYQYQARQISGTELGVSSSLATLSNIPYIGFAYAIPSVGWELTMTLWPYFATPDRPFSECQRTREAYAR